MFKNFQPHQLDVVLLAEQGAALEADESGQIALKHFARLAADLPAEREAGGEVLSVRWQARGQLRGAQGSAPEVWLHLNASASVPQTCQRCLQSVSVELAFERAYRFVADEAAAEREDAEAEEDVLVLSRQFDLLGLVEDELLMELPLVSRHERCPVNLPMHSQTPDFVDAQAVSEGEPAALPLTGSGKPNPFAVLASLKLPRS